ncbi:MAG TPA: hypothetical protein VFT59_00410 [Candidatus Saccharimonadales bacterium]|nr:hypothetical protein [Candidatus Saccharimonadales bacterium]
MKYPEKRSIDLFFGDVVQQEYSPPESDELSLSDPAVLIEVKDNCVITAQIINGGERPYLATFGTGYGPLRHVEGARRWTPIEIATAVIDCLYDSEEMDAVIRAEYEVAINGLLISLNERKARSPWHYSF